MLQSGRFPVWETAFAAFSVPRHPWDLRTAAAECRRLPRKIHIGSRQPFARCTGWLSVPKSNASTFFCSHADWLRRNWQLVHPDGAPLCVSFLFQHPQTGSGQFILRILRIICPGKHDFSRLGEGTNIIDMFVGFILIDSARQPDYLFRTQHFQQFLFNFCLAHLRIASGTQQASFRGQNGAFPIAVDAAALQNEIPCIIAIHLEQIAALSGYMIVFFPWKIKAVHQTAPGVELPVHTPNGSICTADKGRCNVSCPGIIGGTFHHPYSIRQHGACRFVLCIINQHGHRFPTGNGSGNLCKGSTCPVTAVLPGIRPIRPDHDAALMRFKFSGHGKTVCFWCAMQQLHEAFPPSAPNPQPICCCSNENLEILYHAAAKNATLPKNHTKWIRI